jgi:NAD(P)-dependent dehydrogenase (short-subunit alcohol dehydrogenase family)
MTGPARFAGQTAVITGAGRGLGRQVALALAREGARVVVMSRTVAEIEETARLAREAGGTATALAGDVRRADDVARSVERTLDSFGVPSVLINCAGIFQMGASTEFPIAAMEDVLATNVTGTFAMCQAFGRHMVTARAGKIVNFASLLSFTAFPERAAYAASKGAVLQLTRVLGVEWAPAGVNVNAIVPGMIKIETPHPAIASGSLRRADIERRIPRGRSGEPQDIVGPTLFLASAAADYICGQSLVVDGGWLSYGYV